MLCARDRQNRGLAIGEVAAGLTSHPTAAPARRSSEQVELRLVDSLGHEDFHAQTDRNRGDPRQDGVPAALSELTGTTGGVAASNRVGRPVTFCLKCPPGTVL